MAGSYRTLDVVHRGLLGSVPAGEILPDTFMRADGTDEAYDLDRLLELELIEPATSKRTPAPDPPADPDPPDPPDPPEPPAPPADAPEGKPEGAKAPADAPAKPKRAPAAKRARRARASKRSSKS